MDKKNQKKLSRFLALVLRHKPEAINLKLDAKGKCSLPELIAKINQRGWPFEVKREHIEKIVADDSKKRYALEDEMIWAQQGHSLTDVQVELTKITPPQYLYHGTAQRFVSQILGQGLRPMKRQHVHLSKDVATATQVGSRRDSKPTILRVDAKKAHEEGTEFYLSGNDVYLAGKVEAKYLEMM